MKSDSIAFGIAGIFFGLIAGWIIGSQQAAQRPVAAAPAPAATAASSAAPRTQLGNLYFDAERYDDAIRWYEEAVKLAPKDVNISTDLGVSYYYSNQPDKALAQFDRSLKLDPKHAKTLLNVGIVRAFGKQDLDGASQAWQQVIAAAPDSQEAQAAKRALDSLRSAHSGTAGAQKPGA